MDAQPTEVAEPQQPATGLLDNAEPEAPEPENVSPESTTVEHQAKTEEIGERPDWCPEKFWNEQTGINSEGLANSYGELEKKMRAGKHKVPEDGYDLSVAKDAGVADDDPVLEVYANWAKDAGISQEHFDQLASQVLQNGAQQAEQEQFNMDAEMTNLGPNAQAIIDDQVAWAQKLVKTGTWGGDDFEEFKVWGGTANGIRALQKLRRYMGDVSNIPVQVNPQADALPSKEECYEMVKSPEYKNNPAYRAKVEQTFAQVFGTGPHEKRIM